MKNYIFHFQTKEICPQKELNGIAEFYSDMIEKYGTIVTDSRIKLKEVIEIEEEEEKEVQPAKKSVDVRPANLHLGDTGWGWR